MMRLAGWIGMLMVGAGAGGAAAQEAGLPSYAARDAVVEEITVGSGEWALPGVVTWPASASPTARVPIVVLVHGSGPGDRDQTVGPQKPFRDLAFGLAAHGIATVRYDKRTKVHGSRMGAEVTLEEETVADALLALELARGLGRADPERVYVVGLSLGGMAVPEIVRRDGALAGGVMMAAGARPLAEMMIEQFTYLASLPANAAPQAQVQLAAMRGLVERVARNEAAPDDVILGAPARYFYDMNERLRPELAADVRGPLLVLQGERDYQVTMEDFGVWQRVFAGRSDVELRSFPALNHLFMAGEGKSTPQEYLVAGVVAAEAIEAIAAFVR